MGKPALDRPERWFSKDPPRAATGELSALAAEAHRRKISYGRLMRDTTRAERAEIVEAYRKGEMKNELTGTSAAPLEALADLPEAGHQALSLAEGLCPGADRPAGISAGAEDRDDDGSDAARFDAGK